MAEVERVPVRSFRMDDGLAIRVFDAGPGFLAFCKEPANRSDEWGFYSISVGVELEELEELMREVHSDGHNAAMTLRLGIAFGQSLGVIADSPVAQAQRMRRSYEMDEATARVLAGTPPETIRQMRDRNRPDEIEKRRKAREEENDG